MRLGDHGRTMLMAVPPTAHAMSGIHQQHDPVDVKSLGDAIHFAAHRCARAESVRGDCAVSASDWTRAPRPNAWTLMPRSTRRPSPRTGGPTSTQSRVVTRQVRGPLEHRPATRQEIVPAGCPAAGKRRPRGRLEPSARSDSGQSRGGFSEQTHGRAGYFEVVGGCGDRCCARPDDSDHGGHAVGLD